MSRFCVNVNDEVVREQQRKDFVCPGPLDLEDDLQMTHAYTRGVRCVVLCCIVCDGPGDHGGTKERRQYVGLWAKDASAIQKLIEANLTSTVKVKQCCVFSVGFII